MQGDSRGKQYLTWIWIRGSDLLAGRASWRNIVFLGATLHSLAQNCNSQRNIESTTTMEVLRASMCQWVQARINAPGHTANNRLQQAGEIVRRYV